MIKILLISMQKNAVNCFASTPLFYIVFVVCTFVEQQRFFSYILCSDCLLPDQGMWSKKVFESRDSQRFVSLPRGTKGRIPVQLRTLIFHDYQFYHIPHLVERTVGIQTNELCWNFAPVNGRLPKLHLYWSFLQYILNL